MVLDGLAMVGLELRLRGGFEIETAVAVAAVVEAGGSCKLVY